MFPTFADLVPVESLSSHLYSVNLENEWCIGSVPNGGYITTVFLVVARTHMSRTHANRSEPNPVNLHLEFLRRTGVGVAHFTVKDIKLGSRISNLQITLSQQLENGKWQDEVEGYVTMSNIKTETGITLDTAYQMHPPTLPVDHTLLASRQEDSNWLLRQKEPFPNFRRATQNVQMFLPKASSKPEDFPKSINEQWIRFCPGKKPGRWTNDAFGLLVDMFPQIVENYVNPHLEEAARSGKKAGASSPEPTALFWYPTLCLNLDIKALLPEEGVEWLYVRVQAKAIRNGRLDLHVEVRDQNLQLMALSNHSALVMDSSRNTAKRGQKRESPSKL